VLALSDATGELEWVSLPADGVGEARALSSDGSVLRFAGVPSPDGSRLAYTDNNQDLWILEIATGRQTRVSAKREGSGEPSWSPDGRWLAFVEQATNTFARIHLHDTRDGTTTALTSDRVNSRRPAFSPDGRFLYFLSDRDLRSVVRGVWGPRQPEPHFDAPMRVYEVALRSGLRSPFQPADELQGPAAGVEPKGEPDSGATPATEIELGGIEGRVRELPIAPGNYADLAAGRDALFMRSSEPGREGKTHLVAVKASAEKPERVRLVEDVLAFELSLEARHLLVRREKELLVLEAAAKAPEAEALAKARLDLTGWRFSIDPRADWRQIFVDAWRMERDYFYDPRMHGLDWEAVRDRYLPLVDRVTTRDELSDVIGRVVGELSALHTSVRGGDHRKGPDEVAVASLGARLVRDEAAGGYRVSRIFRSDPDYPSKLAPLAAPGVGIVEGDVILAINGVPTLEVAHPASLLRDQQGRQVRFSVRSPDASEPRDRIAVPIADEADLRYSAWEYGRRLEVEARGEGRLGYLHLRAMTGDDIDAWYRQFYPVFDRAGLIVDVRHNRGGNIDSLLLEKLLRRAFFYWKGRVGEPYWNMQYAFRGHMVVLVDERTASDGEAFAEGFRRLGLGPVIGTRTWGGEIWLSGENRLSDDGIARAPMFGVYAPDGGWLIEQHGVVPDIEVDNLPRATFEGGDAQLDTAVAWLLERIAADPRPVPAPPPYPERAFEYPR
jgi:tricorn protease